MALCDIPWVPVFGVIFILHPLLGFISTAGALVIFTVAVANELSTRGYLKQGTQQNLQANNNLSLGLRNAEVIKALGMIGQQGAVGRRNMMMR